MKKITEYKDVPKKESSVNEKLEALDRISEHVKQMKDIAEAARERRKNAGV